MVNQRWQKHDKKDANQNQKGAKYGGGKDKVPNWGGNLGKTQPAGFLKGDKKIQEHAQSKGI